MKKIDDNTQTGLVKKDNAHVSNTFRPTLEKTNNIDGEQSALQWALAQYEGKKSPNRANFGNINKFKPRVDLPGFKMVWVLEEDVPSKLEQGFIVNTSAQHVADDYCGRPSKFGTAAVYSSDDGQYLVEMIIPDEWAKDLEDAQQKLVDARETLFKDGAISGEEVQLAGGGKIKISNYSKV